MFGSALLKCSEHQRPFWLTVALSILLLASVSITIAQAAHPSRLAYDLKRDLGALSMLLEGLPKPPALPAVVAREPAPVGR
jgi:hypothetical protein